MPFKLRLPKREKSLDANIKISYVRNGFYHKHDLFDDPFLNSFLFTGPVIEKKIEFESAIHMAYLDAEEMLPSLDRILNKAWRRYKKLARRYSHVVK